MGEPDYAAFRNVLSPLVAIARNNGFGVLIEVADSSIFDNQALPLGADVVCTGVVCPIVDKTKRPLSK